MAGANDFSRSIRDFSKRISRLAEQEEVKFVELFNDDFMARHSKAASMQAFLDVSPWKDTPVEGLGAVLESTEWDQYVAANTSFDSWARMRDTAVAEWARRIVAQP